MALNWWEEDPDLIKGADKIPEQKDLSKLSRLVKEMQETEADIELWKAALAEKTKHLASLRTVQIPEALQDVGLRNLTTADGAYVEIKPFYSGECDTPEHFEWLEKNGEADIAKVTLELRFPLSKTEELDKMRAYLDEKGLPYSEDVTVHHSTLKRWIKDMVEKGKPLDRELFNIQTGFIATVEQKR